jgi:hypothetical protein
LKTYFSDILGIPTEDGFCMSPVHNVFTFPLPYVGFGLYDWTADSPAWNKYNAFNVYILDHQGKFVNLILPSNEVRGSPKGYSRDMALHVQPVQRRNFSTMHYGIIVLHPKFNRAITL